MQCSLYLCVCALMRMFTWLRDSLVPTCNLKYKPKIKKDVQLLLFSIIIGVSKIFLFDWNMGCFFFLKVSLRVDFVVEKNSSRKNRGEFCLHSCLLLTPPQSHALSWHFFLMCGSLCALIYGNVCEGWHGCDFTGHICFRRSVLLRYSK